ncbi:hypothetical protein [Streptomyces sp. NPDC001020]
MCEPDMIAKTGLSARVALSTPVK